jgi:hypothetical protein
MAEDIPALTAQFDVLTQPTFGINGHHNALRAIFLRRIANDLRVGNGGGVEAG